jgi:predicted RNA binding protein YcfA (HicA-like mRNA interferase family)
MKIEDLIERLRGTQSPVSLSDFTRIVKHFGYTFDHATGSHSVFRNWSGRKFVAPVHNKRVKSVYVKLFLKEQE